MKRSIVIFVFLILIAACFKYLSKTEAGILNPDSRVIIEQTVNTAHDPAIRLKTEMDEVRSLEDREVHAVINADTTVLFQIWSSDLTVTNPDNSIENLPDIKKKFIAGKFLKDPFERVIEKITVTGNVAVVMGYETPLAPSSLHKHEKAVSRRFTNIWVKNDHDWKLTARQATNANLSVQ